MQNKETVDKNSSLIIKIDYKNYISLDEFKETIEGWSNQYNSFISQSNEDEKDDRLLIKEIKRGSIIIELVSSLVPLINDFNTVYTFYASIKALFDWLGSKKGTKPKINTNDLDNAKKIVSPAHNHNGRQITVFVTGDNNASIIIDSVVAGIITKNANEEYPALDKPVALPETAKNKKNVIFRLTQIKDDENPNKNTKGIIHEIDAKEHLVLFSNIENKEAILRESSNPFRRNYLADVKINTVNGIIKSYVILCLHDSYTDEESEGRDLFS
jgi:hypothetical protein